MQMTARWLAAPLLLVALAASPAKAATTITASLWDKADEMNMATDLGYAMAGDPKTATMGITLSADSAAAGDVTFDVTNDSTQMIHEMVVVPVTLGTPLPLGADGAVDEDKAGAVGEVSELDPGKSGSVTLNLKPGSYLVLCNVGTHYVNGMWTLLTVK